MRRVLGFPWPGLLAGALALVLGVAGLVWWQSDRGTRLEQAVALAPAESQRLSFTDWAAVRRQVGEASIDSTPEEVTRLLDEAFARDLTSMSALVESTPVLHASFGLSPATIDWELFAQSPEGAVEILRMPDSFDLEAFESRLEALGFERPDEADGVWRGGADLLARLGADLTPEVQHFAVDVDEHLIRSSDSAEHLADVLDQDESAESLERVAAESGEPLVAAVYTGAYACGHLAMSKADDDDAARAEALVEEAGEVHPMAAFAMSARRGGDVRAVLEFETEEQARTNADTRALLAAGEAPGQGGSFADRFSVESTQARENVVVMELDPTDGAYVLSDLTSGPVLFLTC